MMFLSYNSLVNLSEKTIYKPQAASRCVILAKRCSDPSVVEQSKFELFKLLSTILVKNIENFYFLSKNYRDVFHTREDLIGEAYIVFEACLKNFDFRKGKIFYFYYNKALTRAFSRIIDRSYYKHSSSIRFKPEHESVIMFNASSRQNPDFTDFYFDQFRLTDKERRVVKARMEKKKIQTFLDENKDMNWTTYFASLNGAKGKLSELNS